MDQIAWLEKKGTQHGFTIKSLETSKRSPIFPNKDKNKFTGFKTTNLNPTFKRKYKITLQGVQFDGKIPFGTPRRNRTRKSIRIRAPYR